MNVERRRKEAIKIVQNNISGPMPGTLTGENKYILTVMHALEKKSGIDCLGSKLFKKVPY